MDFTKVLDALKAPAYIFVAIAIATSLLLFLPAGALQRAHVDGVVKEYGTWIGLTWVISLAFSAVHAALRVAGFASAVWKKGNSSRTARAAIHTLDHAETAVLREFHLAGRNTLKLPIMDPAVASLLEKRVLKQVGPLLGEQSSVGPLASLGITPHVVSTITREFVGLPAGPIPESQLEYFKNRRPAFTHAVEVHEWLSSGRGIV